MTFETESKRSGRRYLRYVEVDVDECTREWGVFPCAPFAARKYYDDTLTDANGTLLQAHAATGYTWVKTNFSDAIINSNKLSYSSAYESEYYNSNAFSPDVEDIYIDVTFPDPLTGYTALYFFVRSVGFSGTDDHYEVRIDDYGSVWYWSIYRAATPAATVAFESYTPLRGAQDQIRIHLSGYRIEVYLNETLMVSGDDAAIAIGGYTGFYALGSFDVSASPLVIEGFRIYNRETDLSNIATACYKTRSTCQYSQAYDAGTKTYRFFDSTNDALDMGLDGYPLLESVSSAPTRLTPGKGIGIRSELSLKLTDQRHHDRGTDPYVATRTYDPMTQGTFWGKWLARNKYYTGRVVRHYDGFLTDAGYDATNFRMRQYIIDKVDKAKTVTTIKCKDILHKLNTAVAPSPSYVYLVSGITDSQTTIDIDTIGDAKFPLLRSDGTVQYIEPFAGSLPFYRADSTASFIPLTVDNELTFYRADGSYHPIPLVSSEFAIGDTVTVRIGSELITGTVAAGQLTGCTRGARGSTAAAHSAGDTVQKCIVFDNVLPTDALTTLFTYAGIESYINTVTWDEQASKWLGLSRLDGVVSAPEKITSIVERACIQGTVYPWWDDFTQKIELLAVAPQAPLANLTTYTDELNIIEGSASSEQNMREQVTQVLVWYDKINEADDNSAKNMNAVYPVYDAGAESATQWNLSRTAQIECDFVKTTGHASAIGSRMIGRLRDGEQIIKFQTDIKETLKTGDEFIINTDASQAADGSQESVRMQVIEMKEMNGGKMYYEAVKSAFQAARYCVIMDDAATKNFSSATQAEIDGGGYISNNLGFMSDGSEGYKIV